MKTIEQYQEQLREFHRNRDLRDTRYRNRSNERRRMRIAEFPYDWTDHDMVFALKFFNNTCAYCGNHLSKITWDHYIPINSMQSLGTIPENMVPACAQCNYSKNANDPIEWVRSKFANHIKIINTIGDFFTHVRK